MTVLFMDSANGGNGATRWDQYSNINTSSGASPSGRTAYELPTTASALAKSFAPVPSVVVGFYAWNFLSAPGNSNSQRFRILGDGGTTLHLTIYGSDISGAIQVRRGAGNGTLLAESAPGVIQVDTWHHVEIRATIADSDGRCEVWVDGAKVIDFTGDTKNGGTATQIDAVDFRRAATNIPMRISDIVISSASTPVGPATVWLHLPDGDGDHTDLSQEPNSGANWEKVDENPPDGDTTYVYGDTDGEFDLYTLGDLPAGTWDVLAIQTVIDARTDDGGARNLIPVLKTNGSEYRGTSTPVSVSYTTHLEVWETNPDTAAAWSPAEVDALQAGVEVD